MDLTIYKKTVLARTAGLVCSLVIAFSFVGCGDSKLPLTMPKASFSKPVIREVVEWDEYPGRLQSPQTVTLSARVTGVIEKAPFQEGSIVNSGDVLFIIDERPFRAELQSKEADVLSAQAQLTQAQANFKRYETLKGTKAIATGDYDQVLATLQQARARIALAEAARDIAKLNLEWTKVTSPISGRVSKKFVTEGNLVAGGSGQSTPLTSINSVDPMYCNIDAPERALLRYKTIFNEGKASGSQGQLPCSIRLENEQQYAHNGVINFFDNRVIPSTGTVEMRCSIPNGDGFLAPGLFARMRVLGSAAYEAVLIPDAAIGTDQNARFVLLVSNDNAIVRQSVELGALFGSLRSITKGVKADDRVVISGFHLLRPGTKVTPEEVPISAEALVALPMLPEKAQSTPTATTQVVAPVQTGIAQ